MITEDHLGQIYLQLKGKRRRHIGYVSKNSKGVVVYKKYGTEVFKKLKAFGFCVEAIKFIKPDLIKVVWIGGTQAKRGTYTIGKNKFKEVSKFLNFKGYEPQCFIPLKEFHFRKEG
jgi:hypothetical protein|tara:strand:+ start:15520 stop:15867 length:348 start_codon:yes stop_codon:yes gene_type:complete